MINYAISGQRQTITVAQNVFEFPVPVDSTLDRLALQLLTPNASGDAVFDIRINGTTIYGDPLDRPKILSGETEGEVLPAEALVEGDLVAIDLVTVPAGGLVGLYARVELDDGLAGGGGGLGSVVLTGTPTTGQVPTAIDATNAEWADAVGMPGADGADGADGAPGAPGADGADGADGATGPSGLGSVVLTGTPTSGQVPTATSGTAATWQTPSGGGGSSADEVFNTEDDGFDSGTLDAKWSESLTGTTLPTVAINPQEARSQYLVKFAGVNIGSAQITQLYSPAGDFSLTYKVRCQFLGSNTLIYMFLRNTAHTTGVVVGVERAGAAGSFDISLYNLVGFVSAGSVTGTSVNNADAIYVHIQRVGSLWTLLLSMNGVTWKPVATLTLAITINEILLDLSQYGTAVKERMSIDWIRRDWFMW